MADMDTALLYGWIEPRATLPAYDPPPETPCPYCGNPVTRDDDMMTYIIASDCRCGAHRRYFFRVHLTCHETASEQEYEGIFLAMLARIRAEQGMP
jgi:hypothetical protein